MLLKIKNLLSGEECERLAALAQELNFVDGRVSNPANTSKQNLQADPADPKYAESVQVVAAAFSRSREFGELRVAEADRAAAPVPVRARHEVRRACGCRRSSSSRTPSCAPTCPARSSSAIPANYEGGELAMVVGNQTLAFKGAPGEAIVYPSTLLHEVVPVRSGQRLVSITFIESFIADQHERMQVYELNEIAALEGMRMNPESRVRLDVVRQNLLRMWSTT